MDTSIIDKYIIGRVEPQIYAFSTGTVPNYLKVGDTYRPVEQRLDEWRRYFPDLEKNFEREAKVDDNTYYRDYAIHHYLESELKLHRLQHDDIHGLSCYSREFFQQATIKDVSDAIIDIKNDFIENKGKYQFYKFTEHPTAITYTYRREEKPFTLRPNQKETVECFKRSVKKGRTNLLMYAVMRFGKTFTALNCALTNKKYQTILVVSGKTDVKEEWKKTVESVKNFEGFDFIDSEKLKRNPDIVNKTRSIKHRAVVFLTLQDLCGEIIKKQHQDVFHRLWDMLLIDETHYGARATEYGKVLYLNKQEIKSETKYAETSDKYEHSEGLKLLRARVRIHLSGTPYRILMGSEFQKEDIIAFYQFTDIVKAKNAWDKQHLVDEHCSEWDNPYFGFPQMIRFAFNVNKTSMRKIEELKKNGFQFALNELFRPESMVKSKKRLHLKFLHEQEVLDLLKAIDGTKEDEHILSFLNYDKIKQGKLCRHIVCVLPYRASCDALEVLIRKNVNSFKNLGHYEIINITGVEDENKYMHIADVKSKIESCEKRDRKTLTLTVNRMLTGTTVEQWDTMIYLKDTISPQEYDQATFRLQNQYIRELTDASGHLIKYNMKPQTLLVDFEPGRIFRMQEAKAKIYNVNTNKRGNSKLSERIAEELKISPIIWVNRDKMQEVAPSDILNAVSTYSANKSIMDEATEIPVDNALLDNEEIRSAIKPLFPIDSKKALKMSANKGEGDDLDTGNIPDGQMGINKIPVLNAKHKMDNDLAVLEKKLSSFYSLILFFAFLTDSKVKSLDNILRVVAKDRANQRIVKNLGLNINVLRIIQANINPFTLSELDYKVSHMNMLSHDRTIKPVERVERAMKKFGRLSTSEFVTPMCVAKKMVDYLPHKKIQEGTKILDIASKQGEFANALYEVYGNKIKKSIYSLSTSSLTYEFTRKVYTFLCLPIANVIEGYNCYDLLIEGRKDKIMEKLNLIDPDIIIGNPPYQDNAIGDQKTFNGPLYNRYMDVAYRLSDVVEMIHPARFLSNAGSTPKAWNRQMLDDPHFSIKEYWPVSNKLFEDTDIKGGIVVSLHDTETSQKPIGIFTPYPDMNSIIKKVYGRKDFKSMSDIVVSRTAYRFTELMHTEHPEALARLSEGHPYDVSTNIFERLPQIFFDKKPQDGNDYIGILGRIDNKRTIKFVRRDYIRPVDNLDSYKIFLASANSSGVFGETLTPPIIGRPSIGNTETFVSLGKFTTVFEAKAIKKYITTKFTRALLGVLKTTQHITPEIWKYVPLQNFTLISDIDWTLPVDKINLLLYKKYQFSVKERDFIDNKVI